MYSISTKNYIIIFLTKHCNTELINCLCDWNWNDLLVNILGALSPRPAFLSGSLLLCVWQTQVVYGSCFRNIAQNETIYDTLQTLSLYNSFRKASVLKFYLSF